MAGELAPVVPGYRMQFPADHGAHPEFGVEWWYFTGFLDLEQGGLRSFQITFFRYRPATGTWSANPSKFTPHQIIMAHAAMGEPVKQRFRHWQRIGRVGLGLAWAHAAKLDVRVQDWWLKAGEPGWRSRIELDDERWDLEFKLPKAPVRHGDNGMSRKGNKIGQASYYYSFPRMEVSGTISTVVDGEEREARVRGRAWMDHEWSSEPLDPGARGWDWVGLRLDDGGVLMAYRFRDEDGKQRFIGGTWVTPDGSVHSLDGNELSMTPLVTSARTSRAAIWRSEKTGAEYPLVWKIVAPPGVLRVEALFPQQEMVTAVGPRYWEGAVRVSGDRGGEGFLEMTGYVNGSGPSRSIP